jgi:hypothetical protein
MIPGQLFLGSFPRHKRLRFSGRLNSRGENWKNRAGIVIFLLAAGGMAINLPATGLQGGQRHDSDFFSRIPSP